MKLFLRLFIFLIFLQLPIGSCHKEIVPVSVTIKKDYIHYIHIKIYQKEIPSYILNKFLEIPNIKTQIAENNSMIFYIGPFSSIDSVFQEQDILKNKFQLESTIVTLEK